MENNFNEKFMAVAEDKEFIAKVCTAENEDQVKAFFKEKDIDMDDDAAKGFLEEVKRGINNELTVDELEDVSGGGILTALGFCAGATIGAWAVVGVTGGVVLGVACVKLYSLVKYGK